MKYKIKSIPDFPLLEYWKKWFSAYCREFHKDKALQEKILKDIIKKSRANS